MASESGSREELLKSAGSMGKENAEQSAVFSSGGDDLSGQTRPSDEQPANAPNVRTLVSLVLTEGVGPMVTRNLLAAFGSADRIENATKADLTAVPGVSRELAEAIHRTLQSSAADEELQRAERLGLKVIPFDSPRYPRHLAKIPDPPVILFVKGELQERDALALAIVGARRCTHYGRIQAQRFSGRLAAAGFTIVSGLARGIDIAAHEAALRAEGRTIAVLAFGHGRLPKQYAELAERIAKSGALVSELPTTTPASRKTFPPRNRLISGLSLGVLVVEGMRSSGSMITANWAAEQGREVFALPGQVDNPQSRGPHHLIKEGAKLVETPQDIVDELGPLAEVIQIEDDREIEDPRILSLNKNEQRVFRAVETSPKSIDAITRAVDLPAGLCSSTLFILEVRGLVKRLPGNQYVRA